MANNYFRFKEFIVYQQQAAMKVTTDACLFGAVAAKVLADEAKKQALDIGTGTGLLSLMFAQKNLQASIDAVEIDEDAANEAASNFASAVFSGRLTIHYTDIRHFDTAKRYDAIFCNPPFYELDLKSLDAKRNKALHDTALTLKELLQQIERLLAPGGRFAILLPFHRTNMFTDAAAGHNLYGYKKIAVRQTEKHQPFRSIIFFKAGKTEKVSEETITIKINNEYSDEFKQLLEDYYLYL